MQKIGFAGLVKLPCRTYESLFDFFLHEVGVQGACVKLLVDNYVVCELCNS